MATLYLMIGAPGAGKTGYCSKHMGELDVRISMDDLQQMMGGDRYSNYRKALKEVYRHVEMDILVTALREGHDVWLDRTNMDRERRKWYIRMAHRIGDHRVVAVNFMAMQLLSDRWLLSRRMHDDRGVPEAQWKEVIQNMLNSYEPPALDEGFGEIVDVKLEEVTE